MNGNLLSIVLPVYNEELTLDDFFRSAISELKKLSLDFEMVFVNDGSVDRSAEIIKSYARDYSNVVLVEHSTNKGYGAALRSGFKAAQGNLIFFCDADGQFDLKDLAGLIDNLENADFVVGYRIKRSDPFFRIVFAHLWTGLINLLFGVKAKDIDCAFKLFRGEVLDKITLRSRGAFINAEIFIEARRHNFVFKQVGVNHYPRKFGKPTGANFPVILRAFRELFNFVLKKGPP